MRIRISLFFLWVILLFPVGRLNAGNVQDSVLLNASEVADLLVEEACRHLGAPYIYGAEGPRSFDCSGLTQYVYRKMGYSLPRTSSEQAIYGKRVEGHLYELQKGDLLFFSRALNSNSVRHVGIFIETDSTGHDGVFIHASRHGVVLSKLSEAYYKNRFLSACRILPDFVCAVASTDSTDSDMPSAVRVENPMDTLDLSPSDRRIILLADGTWLLGDSTGVYRTSTDEGLITLMNNGHWKYTEPSVIKVPSAVRTSRQEAGTQAASPQTVQANPVQAPAAGDETPEYYTIQKGDSLSKIASRQHTTVAALCRLNGITENSIIRYGYKLRIR